MLVVIGGVTPPEAIQKYINAQACTGNAAACGLILFFNNLVKLLTVIAGLYAFINLILAGYAFMSAGGDPKAVEKAWAKIWQSLIGLLIIAGAFVLTAIFGWILFGNPAAILIPVIYGP